MTNVRLDISMSLDGFVAGPDATLELPLGVGGDRLHEWVFGLKTFRENHGMRGGETNRDDEVVAEGLAANGAVVMGRRMFSGGEGPWAGDPNANGWWGDEPPFGHPVFVLTHHEREPVEMAAGTSFHFVTEGIESAVAQARQAAGEQDVSIGGGAETIQQCLAAGLLDELLLNQVPILLGAGTRLLENLPAGTRFELTRVVAGPEAAHLTYRVEG